MDILAYKKIPASFNIWSETLLVVAQSVIEHIANDQFEVIHIGSTSFKAGGKGIIDLSILYNAGELALAVDHLKQLGFQDQISDKPFPEHRPRKDGAVLYKGQVYYLHVHAIAKNSEEHHNQLKYKNYMLNSPTARAAYEQAKKTILTNGTNEQEAYAKQKSPFVKARLKEIG